MAKKDNVEIDGLSKKERKALEARAAEIEAELARKAAKKAAKSKGKPPAEVEPEAPAEGGTPDSDEAIKARLADKRAQREAAKAALEALDRSDAEAVAAFNETHGKVLGHYATSEDESAARDATLNGVTPADVIAKAEEVIAGASSPGAVKSAKAAKAKAEAALAAAPVPEGDYNDPLLGIGMMAAQVAEEVETDHGREFAVGSAKPVDDFATVADIDAKPEVELNGNGQYKIQAPDGKVRGYTRVTTFIDCLEDKSALRDWEMRVLLEGIVTNEGEVGTGRTGTGGDLFTSKVRDLIHNRDVELARIAKRDRKGKLKPGERGPAEAAIWSTFKAAVNAIASDALDLGGRHEKASKGTDLHALADVYDTKGPDEIDAMLHDGVITVSDHADVMAYGEAMKRAGIKVVGVERVVVNDERKVAGRLDRILLVKFPGAQRAVRVVGDLKTGRVDYGTGKIAMQLAVYSECKGYDPEHPDAREELRLSRTKAVLIHLPQGSAHCTIHEVDLAAAKVGTKLATEVRAWRNAGKRTIDLKADLASGAGDKTTAEVA